MLRLARLFTLFLSMFAAVLFTSSANATDSKFFTSLNGKWVGPGEIVAGKYKGTKFVCVFDGTPPAGSTGLEIGGYCRVGMFSQPMNALIKKASSGYTGQFLDGEAGEGMNIVGGQYSANKLVVKIKRKDLNGVLLARRTKNDQLRMTISVYVGKELVPVIGMALKRNGTVDPTKLSSTAQ